MRLNYKPYKRSAHCLWYGEFISISAKVLVFAFEVSVIFGTILASGYAMGKLLE